MDDSQLKAIADFDEIIRLEAPELVEKAKQEIERVCD